MKNEDIIAATLGADLWAFQANAIWVVYWTIGFLLGSPEGIKPLIVEIDKAREEWKSSHPSTPLTSSSFPDFLSESSEKFPLVTSSIHETLRLATSSSSIRRVTESTEFAGFKLEVGDRVVCMSRSVHFCSS